MTINNKPKLIKIENSIDDRGNISHCNTFNFTKNKIKRFYKVSNHNINFVRAWHGHKKENKFLLLVSGAIKVCTVKIDNWKNPSKNLNIKSFFLDEKNNNILHIPGGYAHGTQNLTYDTKFVVFSTHNLKESLKDDYRYNWNYWSNWNIKNR